MPHIEAFRGLRYDLGHVGALADVTAPPYDVINPELQEHLYKIHPANVIRLILNRDEPGDNEGNNRYTRSAKFLRDWRRQGVLRQDDSPSLYVYHQGFEVLGEQRIRRGFMAKVRLEEFGQGNIFPHEETHAEAKEDRLQLIRAAKANLSQIFGLYPDPENIVMDRLDGLIQSSPPVEAVDHLGVLHRLWFVEDEQAISDVVAEMASKPLFIADGHHRYETACNYRRELEKQGGFSKDHPANFVLTMCVGMSDPGMVVLPTHRLFPGLATLEAPDLNTRLQDHFDISAAGTGPDQAKMVWAEIQSENNQGTIGLFTPKDQHWTLVRINPAGAEEMKRIAGEKSQAWRNLGVAVLHRLIIQNLLDSDEVETPVYVHQVDEVARELEKSHPESVGYQLAALVMPAAIEDIQQISTAGERMPAKSTYFYPKLLSGLVFHLLEP